MDATAAVYTPGDYRNPVMSQPASMGLPALGQSVNFGPVSVPLWGVLTVIALVLFMERRRIGRGL